MFSALVVVAIALQSAQAWTSHEFSTRTDIQCSTRSGSGGIAPTPIPTNGADGRFSTSIAGTTSTDQFRHRVTASSTVTVKIQTAYEYWDTVETVTSPTWTTYSLVHSVFATATWPLTVCTDGAKPRTVTEYTGSYAPVSGQVTTLPATYPTQVVCTGGVTTIHIGHEVVTSGTSTETVTATLTIFDPTTTETITVVWGTDTEYATTVTKTTTSYTVGYTATTIKTACEPAYTTTYAAKCAPTNLIAAINNVGLVSGDYADGTAVSYGRNDDEDQYHNDPSLCCQTCLDNEGCGGSMGGVGGACGLLFTPANGTAGGARCGDFIFSYQSEEGKVAGQGLVVQSGCQLIEFKGHHIPGHLRGEAAGS